MVIFHIAQLNYEDLMDNNNTQILPSACLGVIGGGQLGQMFAISAKQMGYKVAVLEPANEFPAKQFADYHIQDKYDGTSGLEQLKQVAQVVTTEFENVPYLTLQQLAQHMPVHPNSSAVSIAQNRVQEKKFLNQLGIQTVRYHSICNLDDITQIDVDMFPAILKTTTLGYDGKGQIRVNNKQELFNAFVALNYQPTILENLVDLKLEVSVIIARNSWETIAYPVIENIHHKGILDISIAPARISENIKNQIGQIGIKIAEKLDYIGVLAIEFFITKDEQILANEMAPRPHNSGHLTIDACNTSQFEQQVRSICNLKLGDTHLHSNAIMLNLLGDIWQDKQTPPDLSGILGKYANLKLHLYGKVTARPGRKMGHLTLIGQDLDILYTQIQQIKRELKL